MNVSADAGHRMPSAVSFALLFWAVVALTACGTKARCDAPEATEKMLALAGRSVMVDLAQQCATSLYKKIPAVATACQAGPEGTGEACRQSCDAWAQGAVTSRVTKVDTTFADDTIATVSCRASVRFDVAFDGGQKVDAVIAYLVAPQNSALQVVLSQ